MLQQTIDFRRAVNVAYSSNRSNLFDGPQCSTVENETCARAVRKLPDSSWIIRGAIFRMFFAPLHLLIKLESGKMLPYRSYIYIYLKPTYPHRASPFSEVVSAENG